jgi:hypothetical protein
MRFVPTQTVEQQGCLMHHRARHLFIRQQTAVINSIRAYLAEFGIVAPVGRRGVEQLLEVVADTADYRLPEVARACLAALGSQLRALKARILEFDRRIIAGIDQARRANGWTRSPASGQRWSPALPTQQPSDWDETSRPGSGSCQGRTRAGARTSSAVSANKAIAICAACSRLARSP